MVSDKAAVSVEVVGGELAEQVDGPLAPVAHVALPAGVSQVDFDAALAAGREKGHLTQDELIDALHAVELTPEVLATLLARINAEGVALVEDDEEEDLVRDLDDRRE